MPTDLLPVPHRQQNVNDPAFDVAPQMIPMDYFLLAWSELDYRSATIRPK